MGKRKWMGIYIAALVALLAGPSLSSAAGPERINESFVMGDTGCQMNIELDGDTGGIVSAELGPAFEPPASPPPVQYSFNFTGVVHSVTGTPPNGISIDTTYTGTLTYAPSTFALGATTSDSQLYESAGSSTIATLSVVFNNAGSPAIQSFQTSSFGYSSVVNNTPDCTGCSGNILDMYDFYSENMSSNPFLNFGVQSILFLRDEDPTNPDALSGLAYPTNLNLADWSSPSSRLTVFASGSWQVDGRLTSLTPTGVPSPPDGIIINSVVSPTALESAAVTGCVESLPVGLISDTLICKDCSDNGDGTFDCTQATCEAKTAVEQNIMEKSGDGSTYCYYDKLGRRVCKTI